MSNGARVCPTITLPFGLFAGTPTIAPLDPADFPPAGQPPGLEDFILANAPTDATPLDGFDTAFLETVGIIDALAGALDSLGGELLTSFAEADLIDPAPVGDTVAGFGASLGPSDTSVSNLGTLLGAAGTPTPPQPFPIGASTAGPPACDATLDMGDPNSVPAPVAVTVDLNNPTKSDVHIKKITLYQADPTVYSVTTTCTGTIPAGGSCQFTITRNSKPAFHYEGALSVESDGSPAVTTLCLFAGLTGGGSGGGGWGSGHHGGR